MSSENVIEVVPTSKTQVMGERPGTVSPDLAGDAVLDQSYGQLPQDEIMEAISMIKKRNPGRLSAEDRALAEQVAVPKESKPPVVADVLAAEAKKALEAKTQPGAPETPQTEPVAEVKKAPEGDTLEDKRMATKFANLHRQSQELFQQQETLKAERAKLEETYSRYKEFEALTPDEIRAFMDAKASPGKLLQAMGFKSLDELLQRFAHDGGVETPEARAVRELKAQVDQMKAEKEEAERVRAETERESTEKAAYDSFVGEIGSFVKQNAQKYGLLQLPGGIDAVFNEMRNYFTETGEELSFDEAAAKAEALVEQNINEHLVTNPKVQELVRRQIAKSSPQGNGPESFKAPVRTLSSQVGSRSAPVSDSEQDKSDEQLLAESLAYLKRRR